MTFPQLQFSKHHLSCGWAEQMRKNKDRLFWRGWKSSYNAVSLSVKPSWPLSPSRFSPLLVSNASSGWNGTFRIPWGTKLIRKWNNFHGVVSSNKALNFFLEDSIVFHTALLSGIRNHCALVFELGRNREWNICDPEGWLQVNRLLLLQWVYVGDDVLQEPNWILREGLCWQQAVAGSPVHSSL